MYRHIFLETENVRQLDARSPYNFTRPLNIEFYSRLQRSWTNLLIIYFYMYSKIQI